MSRVQDFFGVAPTTVLNKPFMHVQDQKNSGTAGGDSVVNYNYRDLNTVVVNEISGAALSSNQITLAAGKYYVEGESLGQLEDGVKSMIIDTGSVILLEGLSRAPLTSAGGGANHGVAGVIALLATTTINLVSDIKIAAYNGLGNAGGRGSYECYSDLKIWQLDAVIKTPVLVNDKLFPLPGNTLVTGNMHGLDYAKTADNQVTVQAGICMDSLNTTILSLSTPAVVAVGTVINQIYNLFLCDDGVVRTDTDVSGANLSAYKFRWVGFVLNDATGVLVDFSMAGSTFDFIEYVTLVTAEANVTTSFSLAAVVPVSRCESVIIRAYNLTAGYSFMYQDGGFYSAEVITASVSSQPICFAPLTNLDYLAIRTGTGSVTGSIQQVKLKR